MSESQGTAQERFGNLVKLRLRKRRYLSEPDLRALLLEAFELGLSHDEAQAVLGAVPSRQPIRHQAAVETAVLEIPTTWAGNRGRISPANFCKPPRSFREFPN